ncbi:hypothetical protein [Gynuella sunshinyii]|uniref:Cytochrome c domain-containing protein n=1 Tax=Gynuella sunshinyii YC6258 TaxID=1445510 RepID=A0A0C5VBJ1_9GAMM|nr:hypothetical protein [Gynuella sunshinyii]AJQ96710.1 hypothetical Protein YC6258_04678 [Gynuella sunshinyii YC6258]
MMNKFFVMLLGILPFLFCTFQSAAGTESGQSDHAGNIDGPSVLSHHCMTCHTQHGAWAKLKTDQDWVDSGLISVDDQGKGDPAMSEIVIKSRQNPYNNAGNMPLVENGYGTNELNIVIEWIESIRTKPTAP